MREILFRGKCNETCKYKGQWIEGFYGEDDGKPIIVRSTGPGFGYFCEPNSIGQYTGLTDKNGTKVFEGDIIKICGQHSCFDKVEFLDGLAGFYAVNDDIHIPAELATLKKNFIEVIGNIYDNPELLEAKY